MTPLRFVVLAVLIYILFRLLIGGRKRKNDDGVKRWKDSKRDGAINDVLVEDPICHTLIPRQQAVHLQHQGVIVYFCSETCCERFLEQGEKK